MPKADGFTFDVLSPDEIKSEVLERFAFDSPSQVISTKTDEFTAVCPFSGLRDFGSLLVEYLPDGGFCVELKSLKYYMLSFQNVGIYQELATKRIFTDLQRLLNTSKLRVTLTYNSRGGFITTCTEGSL